MGDHFYIDLPRTVGAMLGLKRAAPTASMYSERAKGPMACPAWRTLGIAEMIMITWATPQIATPMQMVLNWPSFASASQPPNMGL